MTRKKQTKKKPIKKKAGNNVGISEDIGMVLNILNQRLTEVESRFSTLDLFMVSLAKVLIDNGVIANGAIQLAMHEQLQHLAGVAATSPEDDPPADGGSGLESGDEGEGTKTGKET